MDDGRRPYHGSDHRAGGGFKELRGHFDLIVNTVSAPLPIDNYLSLLALDGALVNVGAPPEPLPVRVFSLLNNRRSAGSSIGGIRQTQEMLDFCANRIVASDLRLPFGGVNDTASAGSSVAFAAELARRHIGASRSSSPPFTELPGGCGGQRPT